MYFYINPFRQINNYSRNDAVRYAKTYAINPNPAYRYFSVHEVGGGDCSNFISQCLYAGGAKMDFSSNWPWWYKRGNLNNYNGDTWSMSWTVAHSLYWTLKSRGALPLSGIKATEVSDVSMLDLGDLIQYEEEIGRIIHSAIITAFTYYGGVKTPLVSHHTSNSLNAPYLKPWAKKMHFMKISI